VTCDAAVYIKSHDLGGGDCLVERESLGLARLGGQSTGAGPAVTSKGRLWGHR
jgi:hypothetical protein